MSQTVAQPPTTSATPSSHMSLVDRLWLKIQQHSLLGVVFIVVAAFTALGKAINGLDRTKSILADLVSHAVSIDYGTHKFIVKNAYAWGILGFFVLLLVLVLLVLRARDELRELRSDLANLRVITEKRSKVVEKTFEKMMLAASQILGQLYPN